MWPFRRRKTTPPVSLTVAMTMTKTDREGNVSTEVIPPSTAKPRSERQRKQDNERYQKQVRWMQSSGYLKAKADCAQHFSLIERMEQAFKQRERRGTAPTIAICEEMIRLAPWAAKAFVDLYPKEFYPADSNRRLPSHPGFKQLAIIREKEGRFNEALALCQQARSQGWTGDWDKRIDRLAARLK